MTTGQKIAAIRQKCIAANPSKIWERESYHEDDTACSFELPLTLADVLLAIDNMLVIVDAWGNFYRMKMKLSDKLPQLDQHLGKWNLLADDLELQSDECISFIHSILDV